MRDRECGGILRTSHLQGPQHRRAFPDGGAEPPEVLTGQLLSPALSPLEVLPRICLTLALSSLLLLKALVLDCSCFGGRVVASPVEEVN